MRSREAEEEPVVVEDPADLLVLALSHQRVASASARFLLGTAQTARTRTFAHHALGLVAREAGDLTRAMHHLRRGLRLAEAEGLTDRAADIGATLGTVLAIAGRVEDSEAHFDRALQSSSGLLAAKVRMRRGAMHGQVQGRFADALADYRAALPVFRRHGDRVWEARTLAARARARLACGDLAGSDADLSRAEAIQLSLGSVYESANYRHSRGEAAAIAGELAAALAHLDVAQARYEEVGAVVPELHVDRAATLLSAGMPADARAAAGTAYALLQEDTAATARRATAALAAAEAAVAAGDPAAGRRYALEAARLHARHGNDAGAARARLTAARALHAAGAHDARLLRELADLRRRLGDRNDRAEADLLAGRVALVRRDLAAAVPHLAAAARVRTRGMALTRARGWLAAALLAEARGRRRDVLRACDTGLAVLDEHRLTLGATEMRAAATAHGAELAEIGLRHALSTGDPATLLAWSERWRATALAVPPVRPPDDAELAADLAALREVTRRIGEAAAAGAPTTALDRERARLEESARARTLRTRGEGSTLPVRPEPEEVLRALGRARLVELVAVDGRLHVLVGGAAGVRRHDAGGLEDAAHEVDMVRFSLHRIARPARGRAGEVLAQAAVRSLEASARLLQQHLLGPAVDDLGDDDPLVVVPPGRLHAVPWGLLPALRGRGVTVAPSAAVWLRARRTRPPRRRDVALVHGPGLGTGGAEVPALVPAYDGATVLGGGTATAEAVLHALDGAWLAHVAAHGEFRADNPMFSSLRLDDGPLTVHDLCRLRRAPYRVLLSACESGLAATTGADELLGLASALVPLGTVGLLASVVPVNDRATVPLMLTVHDRLRGGADLAEALRDARRAADESGDPLATATAAAFVALGAA